MQAAPRSSEDGGPRWLLVLFSICVLGVMLKQLRLLGESVGLFEIVGLVCALFFIATSRKPPSDADVIVAKLTLAMTASYAMGAMISAVFFPEHVSPRELIATVYVLLLLLGWIAVPRDVADKVTLLRNVTAIYVGVMVFAAILSFGKLPNLWYFDTFLGRLQGLSDNPNQLASICVLGVVMTALLLAMGKPARLADLAALAVFCVTGIMTQSVALMGSIFISAFIATAVFASASDAPSWAKRLHRLLMAALLVCAVVALLLFGGAIIDGIQYLYSGGSGKGIVRLGYWLSALAFLPYSPIFGFGPGAHVQIDGSTQLQEAHNVFIDIIMSGGLVAVVAFVLLLALPLSIALRRHLPLVLFAALVLIMFSSFQTVLRYAMFWIAAHALLHAALAASASAPTPPQPSPTTGRG